jgi:hypothetical protein
VYVRHRGSWEPFLDRVSTACVEMVLTEVLLAPGKPGNNMCELPAKLIITVESAYEHMTLPEYPLWAEPGITLSWFSAPGKLLRMDGRGPYCWLSVRGRTRPISNPFARRSPGPGAWRRESPWNPDNLRWMVGLNASSPRRLPRSSAITDAGQKGRPWEILPTARPVTG